MDHTPYLPRGARHRYIMLLLPHAHPISKLSPPPAHLSEVLLMHDNLVQETALGTDSGVVEAYVGLKRCA